MAQEVPWVGDTIRIKVDYAFIPQTAAGRADAMWRAKGIAPDRTYWLFQAPREEIKKMRKALNEGRTVDVDLPVSLLLRQL